MFVLEVNMICKCGSQAINIDAISKGGRGIECDVCYWKNKYLKAYNLLLGCNQALWDFPSEDDELDLINKLEDFFMGQGV
jgi:hypothetical protein